MASISPVLLCRGARGLATVTLAASYRHAPPDVPRPPPDVVPAE
jgi:hypothetical protein